MKPVTIKMFSEFSLSSDGVVISDNSNRAKKVWSLLAFLLNNRGTPLSRSKIIAGIWENEGESSNPENALRITLHRLRSMLDGLWEGAGMELILYKNGSYMWNPDAPVDIDGERFENLIKGDYPDNRSKLAAYVEALGLYRGEYLPKFSSELWVIPVAAHYHNLYLEAGMDAGEMLLENGDLSLAANICRQVAASEPYHEPLHQLLMRIYGAKGDRKAAARTYETLAKRLMDDFGLHPTDKTRKVYRRTAFTPETRTLPAEEVLVALQEPPTPPGAMVCDYDYFKILCFAKKRTMEREGGRTNVALLSLTDKEGGRLPSRGLENTMSQMELQLRKNLRRGDTISRCSTSQFIVMLAGANFENSNMVCRRILAAYHKAYPRANVKVNYMVYPLTPEAQVP